MDYGQTKYSPLLLGTTCYLHRPTIKGLYSEQICLVDEFQKTAVDCNRDFIYIVNMTKPVTNRH